MATTKTPIIDATDEQLRDFCELRQIDGIDEARSRSDIIALIGPVWEHDYIPTTVVPDLGDMLDAQELEQRERVVAPAGQVIGGAYDDPRYKIRIGVTPMPGGKDPVPVGVNGVTVVIQRNMVVDLPARFYDALQNSIRQEVDQEQTVGADIILTETTNYPVSTLASPSAEELRAWRERTDASLAA